MQQVGPLAYTATIAIPSLIGAGLTHVSPVVDAYYMSQPWERIANYLGDVDDTYLPGANTIGTFYYLYTLVISGAMRE